MPVPSNPLRSAYYARCLGYIASTKNQAPNLSDRDLCSRAADLVSRFVRRVHNPVLIARGIQKLVDSGKLHPSIGRLAAELSKEPPVPPKPQQPQLPQQARRQATPLMQTDMLAPTPNSGGRAQMAFRPDLPKPMRLSARNLLREIGHRRGTGATG